MTNKGKLFLTAFVPLFVLACVLLVLLSSSLNSVVTDPSVSQDQAFGLLLKRGMIVLIVAVPLLALFQTLAVLFFFRPPGATLNETLEERLSSILAGKSEKDMFQSVLELYKTAVTDPATGSVIFRHFKTMLESELEKARRYKFPLSLVKIRILGKDRARIPPGRISSHIRGVLRNVDVISVEGVRDFVALLPHTNKTNAEKAVWRIWKRIKSVEEQTDVRIPLVAGIVSLPDDGETIAGLLAKLDEYCRRAESFGPGRIIF